MICSVPDYADFLFFLLKMLIRRLRLNMDHKINLEVTLADNAALPDGGARQALLHSSVKVLHTIKKSFTVLAELP